MCIRDRSGSGDVPDHAVGVLALPVVVAPRGALEGHGHAAAVARQRLNDAGAILDAVCFVDEGAVPAVELSGVVGEVIASGEVERSSELAVCDSFARGRKGKFGAVVELVAVGENLELTAEDGVVVGEHLRGVAVEGNVRVGRGHEHDLCIMGPPVRALTTISQKANRLSLIPCADPTSKLQGALAWSPSRPPRQPAQKGGCPTMRITAPVDATTIARHLRLSSCGT